MFIHNIKFNLYILIKEIKIYYDLLKIYIVFNLIGQECYGDENIKGYDFVPSELINEVIDTLLSKDQKINILLDNSKLENIKNNLRDNDYYFLQKIQSYIDTDLYFYGSVARADYFPGESDIDVVVITDNVESVVKKLQHFLNVGKNSLEKTIHYMYEIKKVSYARKISYVDLENNLSIEIFVYDEKYRDALINDMNIKNQFLSININRK